MPERIHLPNYLTKNPPNTARVMRPSMWGNPFDLNRWSLEESVANHRDWVLSSDTPLEWKAKSGRVYTFDPAMVREMAPRLLRGKNLACTCPTGACCHGDVLLEIANR